MKIYLFIGDQVPLYTSHYLFMQPFSRYNVLHFTDLIERIQCHCYQRLIFCGFQKTQREGQSVLMPLDRMTVASNSELAAHGIPTSVVPLFSSMIRWYNDYVDERDDRLEHDIKLWKQQALRKWIGNRTEFDSLSNVDRWFFIGFYQRHYRRTWSE